MTERTLLSPLSWSSPRGRSPTGLGKVRRPCCLKVSPGQGIRMGLPLHYKQRSQYPIHQIPKLSLYSPLCRWLFLQAISNTLLRGPGFAPNTYQPPNPSNGLSLPSNHVSQSKTRHRKASASGFSTHIPFTMVPIPISSCCPYARKRSRRSDTNKAPVVADHQTPSMLSRESTPTRQSFERRVEEVKVSKTYVAGCPSSSPLHPTTNWRPL